LEEDRKRQAGTAFYIKRGGKKRGGKTNPFSNAPMSTKGPRKFTETRSQTSRPKTGSQTDRKKCLGRTVPFWKSGGGGGG